MLIQSETIYPKSIMAHLTSFEFCPVFDKNRAKVRLCVCSGVLIMITYGHDRFFVTVTSHMDIIHDMTKWAVHLCSRTLCWFAYFAASCVCRRLGFLPSVDYRINTEVECYHRYNDCNILITRMVSLLPSYHHTHCLSDHILLAVSELQRSHD